MRNLTGRERKILAKIYCSQFSKEDSRIDHIAELLETDRSNLLRELESLDRAGLIIVNKGRAKLTDSGRRDIIVVMAGGSFDIIHPGHLHTLEQAKALGDALIVSIARDSTFRKNKKREPNHDERLRQKLVSSLRVVDSAVLGSDQDILDTVEKLHPDIIVLGYDQKHNENEMKKGLRKRGVKVKILRLKSSIPKVKTSSILKTGKENLLERL